MYDSNLIDTSYLLACFILLYCEQGLGLGLVGAHMPCSMSMSPCPCVELMDHNSSQWYGIVVLASFMPEDGDCTFLLSKKKNHTCHKINVFAICRTSHDMFHNRKNKLGVLCKNDFVSRKVKELYFTLGKSSLCSVVGILA